jgi:predicted  nucleic acid-binding Zn-ribbon protein
MPTTDLPDIQISDSVEQLWGLALQVAGCRQCGQAFLVESARLGQPCPNCACGKLESQPARLSCQPPELVVPFAKTQADVRAAIENFVKGVWLAPDDFNTEQLLHRAVAVFWPMWLVDGSVVGVWQAEAGFDYQVKSSQESYSNSAWRSREIIETRQRWEPRLGQIVRHYDNVCVPAASDHVRLVGLVGDYRLDKAAAYDKARISRSAMRLPDLPPQSAWPQAQLGLEHAAEQECFKATAAQHIRNYSVKADYENLNWTQMLLPLVVSYYTDDEGKNHPVYINGQSGVIGGMRMASQRKGWQWAGIIAAIAFGLLLLGLLLSVVGLIPLGGLVLFVAILVGMAALVPAAWPWQWNRRQMPEKIVRT